MVSKRGANIIVASYANKQLTDDLDKLGRIKRILLSHPFEWWDLFAIGWCTLWCRLILRCTGKGTVVGSQTTLKNFSNISIGKQCMILDHVYMRAGMQGTITIGNACAINSYAKIFGHGGVTMGDNSQIGPNALITTTSHDRENAMQPEFKPVTIGKWSWIGANVTVLPGIAIGDYAIVGAGAIVTKDVPDYAIVVGNPAKVIGQNTAAIVGSNN